MEDGPDHLTVLRSAKRRAMAKSYFVSTSGTVGRTEYPDALHFSVEQVPVYRIEGLLRALLRLQNDPLACVIRAAPGDDTDLAKTRRKLRRNGGTFEDAPRRWIMIDADKVPLPATMSVIEDPEEVAQHLADLFGDLVPELEGVSCVVQFSASAGISELASAEEAAGLGRRWAGLAKGGNTVSAHIWFWLATPRDGAALDLWGKAANARIGHKVIDLATLRAVQPHYIAAPTFGPGLRDPLNGRRTVLVRGERDAAELVIPEKAPRPERSASDGSSVDLGALGFAGRLDLIGHPEHGFHAPINSAIASYVRARWPLGSSEIEELIEALVERILAADPGGRSEGEISRYANPVGLRARIDWTISREQEDRDSRRAEAAAETPIDPTFPDQGVTAEAGTALATQMVARFAERLAAGETLDMLLRMTVGGGKSRAAIVDADKILAAAHQGGREGALWLFVPRHDLGTELSERIAAAHPGMSVATWRGMEAEDPNAPGETMCRDPELPKAAAAAGLASTEVCSACPLRPGCAYQGQRAQKADLWVGAHNLAFHAKPAGVPPVAVMVIDEAMWPAAVKGLDGTPIQLALSALDDFRTGALRGWMERERLIYLRRLAHRVITGLLPTETPAKPLPVPLPRDAFIAAGFTAAAADEWMSLEWQTQPKAGLREGMDRDTILGRLQEAAEHGFTRLRPNLAKQIRDLLQGNDATSVSVALVADADLGRGQGAGPALRFSWREDFAEWTAEAPRLFLDATTHPDLVRMWAPNLEVAEIEIAAPHQHVRQVADGEFGRSFFAQKPHNVRRLADLAVVELALAPGGDVLVIAQEAVERALRDHLEERFGGELPPRLHLAHHGNLTGLDRFRDVARIVVAGRPAMNRRDGERLAEIIAGRALGTMPGGDKSFWPMAPASIRLADGGGHRIEQPCHPDALVEATRWSVTEGAILQAIGRCRGVQRSAEAPVHVTLLARAALPLTVAEVSTWEDALPDRLTLAAAEAALHGTACPLAPEDMHIARPDLWPTVKAAVKFHENRKTPQSPISNTYRELGGFSGQVAARYRKPGARRWSKALVPAEGGHGVLLDLLGELAAFEILGAPEPPPKGGIRPSAPAAPPPDPAPPEAVMPALDDITVPAAALAWLTLLDRPPAPPWHPLPELPAPVLTLPVEPQEWPADDVGALLGLAEAAGAGISEQYAQAPMRAYRAEIAPWAPGAAAEGVRHRLEPAKPPSARFPANPPVFSEQVPRASAAMEAAMPDDAALDALPEQVGLDPGLMLPLALPLKPYPLPAGITVEASARRLPPSAMLPRARAGDAGDPTVPRFAGLDLVLETRAGRVEVSGIAGHAGAVLRRSAAPGRAIPPETARARAADQA